MSDDNTTHACGVAASTVWREPLNRLDALEPAVRPDLVETQLLLGEPVHVVDECGEWTRVIAPWQPSDKDIRGYPGWVLSEHLAKTDVQSDFEATVTALVAPLHTGISAPPAAPIGTRLPVVTTSRDRVQVGLPGGGSAWLDATDCVIGEASAVDRVSRREFVAAAETMLGVPHVLGGMTPSGMDCSALVHLAFRLLGLVVPRDAEEQHTAGRQFPYEEAREGDLICFRRGDRPIHHVGIAVREPGWMLHAPGRGRAVVQPLPEERRATLVATVSRIAT